MISLNTAPYPQLELRMSRTRAAEPYVQQKVSLPSTLMARFSLLHWDPVLSKPKYGAVSEVVTKLLANYVNQMEQGIDPLEAKPSEPDIKAL